MLEHVNASIQTPRGPAGCLWDRREDPLHSIRMAFLVPPDSNATLYLPVPSVSNVTIRARFGVQAEWVQVYRAGTGLSAPLHSGLQSSFLAVSGSYMAVALRALAGSYEFVLEGSAPVQIQAQALAADQRNASLECPQGMRITSLEHAAFGIVTAAAGREAPQVDTSGGRAAAGISVSCAAGSSRYHAERLCVGHSSCSVPADSALFDPLGSLRTRCAETAGPMALQLVANCGFV